MNEATKTLMQLKKANKLVKLAMRKDGPKSYTRGQGALLRALVKADDEAVAQQVLVHELGVRRAVLKDVVLKAQRNGFVTMEEAEGDKTYAVKLTEEGRELAEKHEAANDETAETIVGLLTAEEKAQLDAITEKLIVGLKETGVDGKGKGRREHRKGRKGCCKKH